MGSYKFEVQIFEGYGGNLKKENSGEIIYPKNLDKEKICAWMYRGDDDKSYKKGQIFKYPEEAGKLCQWMLNDINLVIQVLRLNGKMLWDYKDTPYEKEINEDGITTEFIRCMDPTNSGIVVKIIRKKT